jgi:hypothetical protein
MGAFQRRGVSDQEKPIVDWVSEGFAKQVNHVMEVVYKQYKIWF